MAKIDIVIPNRMTERPDQTLRSLALQTFRDYKIHIIYDHGRGAPWARNRGFAHVTAPFVLFSDNDIDWKPDALQTMLDTLKATPDAAYCYGAYKRDDEIIGDQPFNPQLLKRKAYITTNSLIRAKDFPGFDESLDRWQDYDLWLNLLSRGKVGIFCGKVLFETRTSPQGITSGDERATLRVVREKWRAT